jgi:hypothetical protein
MERKPILKKLALFLLILNIFVMFGSVCYVLFSPQPARAAINFEAAAENECGAHPAPRFNLKFKADKDNQLLPCCFKPINENGQTSSLAELTALKLLQLVKASGAVTSMAGSNTSSYFYVVPAPPPELLFLSSIILRV